MKCSQPPKKTESSSSWVGNFPGLLWIIEVPIARLELITDWQHPDLGANTSLIIKDPEFRQKYIAPEDHLQFVEFWEAMVAGIPASALFKLKTSSQDWLFLQGWPDSEKNWFYHGILQIAPRYLLPSDRTQSDINWAQCRSVAGYPVLLVNSQSGMIVKWNDEAEALLGIELGKKTLSFESLIPSGATRVAKQALETAVNEGVWGGALTLKMPSGATINSEMRLNSTAMGDSPLVRLSFLSASQLKRKRSTNSHTATSTLASKLVGEVSRASSLHQALQVMLASHEPHAFDAIIYSDIHADKGFVTVYGEGKPCADMWGKPFAYEGTIAQNIERHGLNYLVVDDTLDSIKSIDWVLFVPRGIRSYFARPFYRRNKLRAVLILCSVRPGAFSLADAEHYEVLAPAFSGVVFRTKPTLELK